MTDNLRNFYAPPNSENWRDETEGEVMSRREHIEKGFRLSMRIMDSNPSLALRYAVTMPDRKLAGQIALKIAAQFPQTILMNLDLIQGQPWTGEVVTLAKNGDSNKIIY